MKKISKPLGEHLKPVKLHYDDIEEIYQVFSESDGQIIVEADDFEIEQLEEILKINKPFFTNLSVTLRQPYVSVHFKDDRVWLYANEDTPIQRGIFEKIKTILLKKQRPLAPFFLNALLSGMFVGIAPWFFLSMQLMGTKKFWNISFAIFIFFRVIVKCCVWHQAAFLSCPIPFTNLIPWISCPNFS